MSYCNFVEDSTGIGEGYVKVKVKFTLEQTTMAQRGVRGIAILFL